MKSSESLREDLKTFSALGQGLWSDPRVSECSAIETLSASLFFNIDADQRIEKAASALLERAKHSEGGAHQSTVLDFISAPFYRLSLEERFILISLHIGHWSYSRLGRILKVSREKVEERAWAARLKMAAGHSSLSYPAGPSQPAPHCPPYYSKRPWMQRLLDDEVISRVEKISLEQHLPTCSSCAQSLKRAREFYFDLDRKISETVGKRDFADSLERVLREGESLLQRTRPTVTRGLVVLLKRRDVQGLILLWFFMIAVRFFHPFQ